MSLPIRSERKLGFVEDRTPAVVGPGTYVGHGQYAVTQSKVSFSSTAGRSEIGARGEVDGPGPGSYEVEKYVPGPRSFHRGPVAGKTRELSVEIDDEVPGPGTYDLVTDWNQLTSPKRRGVNQQESPRSLVHIGTATSPKPVAIPIPGKHFGYLVDDNNGTLVPYKPPGFDKTYHTGTPNNSVGPGAYLKVDSPSRGKGTTFGNSKTVRNPLFIAKSQQQHPGPGTYEDPMRNREKKEEIASSSCFSRGTSSFASKVPMVHQLSAPKDVGPGPGQYYVPEEDVEGETEGKEPHALALVIPDLDDDVFPPKRKSSAPKTTPKASAGKSGFGSTVDRMNSLGRTLESPYLASTMVSTPGPGSYAKTKRDCWITWRMEQKQARENKKQVGFMSTSERETSSTVNREGEVEPEQVKILRALIKKKQEKPKMQVMRKMNSVFGTTSRKISIFDEFCVPKTGDECTPGPGAYECRTAVPVTEAKSSDNFDSPSEPVARTVLVTNRGPVPSSIFASKTKRFQSTKQKSRKTKDATGPIMEQQVGAEIDQRFAPSAKGRRHHGSQPSVAMRDRNFGSSCFRNNSPRFSGQNSAFADLERRKHIPGPGQYNTVNNPDAKTKNSRRPQTASVSNELRFRPEVSNLETKPGPGQYQVRSSMLKRSYNVTMTNGKSTDWKPKAQLGNSRPKTAGSRPRRAPNPLDLAFTDF